MILRNAFIILLIITVNGCKKNAKIELSGVVTEYYSGDPTGDVDIELVYFPLSYGSVSSGTQSITQTKTNASGVYMITFEEPSASSYQLIARKEGFIIHKEDFSSTDVSSKEENLIDLRLFLDATLRLRLSNSDNSGAQALFRLGKHSEDCETCCNVQTPYTVKGINDTLIECSLYGKQQIDYELTRLTSGTSETERGVLEIGEKGLDISFDY